MMERIVSTLLALRHGALPFVLTALFAGSASAQAKPPDQHTEKVAAEAPKEDTISLSALLGGSLNTGNTQSWQLTTGGDFLIVRNPHSFAAGVQFAYGEADLPDDESEGFEKTVGNLRARARYDFFLTRMDALFVATGFRWDEFAGLDARVQGQAGYVRYFIRTDIHRFWGEVGYDVTYDDYHPLPIIMDGEITGFTPNGDEVVHSARLFAGYDNRINEVLTYLGGLEGLLNVEEPKDLRVNFDNALRSKIGGNFSLEIKFTMLFDNVPVPGAHKLDTQTIASVIYNLI